MASDDHGRCPHCNADLNGGSIWQTGYEFALTGKHYEQRGVPEQRPDAAANLADEYAAAYGATRDHGKWGREIGIYDMLRDRTTHWECPDCGGTFDHARRKLVPAAMGEI